MIQRAVAYARKFLRHHTVNTPITALAEAIVVAPTEEQIALKNAIEPKLLAACEYLIQLDTLSRSMSKLGVHVPIQKHLRAIAKEFKHARNCAAYSIYIEMHKREVLA